MASVRSVEAGRGGNGHRSNPWVALAIIVVGVMVVVPMLLVVLISVLGTSPGK